MNKMKNMREVAEAKMKQAKLAAEHLPKGLSIAGDIISECGEITASTLSLVGFIAVLPAVDSNSIKEVTQSLRDASSNTKELISSLMEVVNELKSAFNTDGDKKKEKGKMSKIEKGIYRINRVVQESCDVVDVAVEIVELVESIIYKLQQGSNENWGEIIADVKEKGLRLVKEVKEMKDAFLGKDEEDEEENSEEKEKEKKSKKGEIEAKSKTQSVEYGITVDDGESEESKSCWSKIFCCCSTD